MFRPGNRLPDFGRRVARLARRLMKDGVDKMSRLLIEPGEIECEVLFDRI